MTMIPDKHTFTIWQGASFYETLVIYSDAAGTNIKDLTDYTAEMIVRDKPNGAELLSIGVSIPSPQTDGKVVLMISAEDTATIPWKGAVYDLTISHDAGGTIVTDALLYGAIKVQGV